MRHDAPGRRLRLVRHHAEHDPPGRQPVQQLRHAVIDLRQPGAVLPVIIPAIVAQRLHRRLVRPGGRGPPVEHQQPVSDEALVGFQRMLWEAKMRQCHIRRRAEIAHRVKQCAVQIKDRRAELRVVKLFHFFRQKFHSTPLFCPFISRTADRQAS